MKNSRKGSALLVVLLIIAIVAIATGYYFFYQKPEVVEVQTDRLKTYMNSQYGFEFKYPEKYGDVILGSEKKYDHASKEYRDTVSLLGAARVYNNYISFSNFPNTDKTISSTTPAIVAIYIVDLTDEEIENKVSNYEDGELMSLVEDKYFLESKEDGVLLETKDTGYTISKYTSEKGLPVVTNDGIGLMGSSVSKYYKTYGNNIALEVHVTYLPFYGTAESAEIHEFKKDAEAKGLSPYLGEHEWLKSGKTSQKIRDVIKEAEGIVDSLTFSQ